MDDLRPASSGWDLLRTVLGEPALPMAVMDDARQLVYVSPALESLAETRFEPISSEQVPSYFQLYDPSGLRRLQPHELPLVRACGGASVQDAYVTVKPADAPARLLRCTAAPLNDGTGEVRGALLVATDVTHEQLASASPELRRQRVAALQHELRTPLAVLRGHAELLQYLGPGLPDDAHQSLDCIVRAVERLTRALDSVSAVLDG